ncbi:hypothetical protein [Pelagicoccus mobilis]|uniref:Uncharacterized protein n=1 Tax=Pelagicoccus mobilis TaxID=415221 RepID=A0A934VRI1_9BACT|nr:hypothetical protein [Pelagicoccus mobilis]MBK1877970.1 hypothetical protein [Pelagicoccus mobilis]
MKKSGLNPAEKLRTLESFAFPDPREEGFKRGISDQNCLSAENQKLLGKRIQIIDQFKLIDTVPEKVQVQFETAKNLYLYAWFVYRFYPVAERQALSTLEMGLREKLDPLIPTYDKTKKQANYRNRFGDLTLAPLLRYVHDEKLVVNEDFELWWHRVKMNAKARRNRMHTEKLLNEEVDSIVFDDDDFTIEGQDKDYDYFGPLTKSLPRSRNTHSHGTSSIMPPGTIIFEITQTILNKIYS